jgi:hypothetical protein
MTRKVTAAEVIGHWKATPAAMESLRSAGHVAHLDVADHQIELRADGTCTFQGVLNISRSGPARDPRYTRETQTCRWKFLDFTEPQEVWIGLDPNDERQTYYWIGEERGQLLLWRHAGAADARQSMELTRVGQ